MKRQVIITLGSLSVLSIFGLVGFGAQQPAISLESTAIEIAANQESTTLENLQTAYNGESNAHALYLAFAEKAQEEGYLQVATLFEAAARAEEIHAANHAKVIREMGGTPEATVEPPVVKSTQENLQAAISGESYERDTMYVQFIDQARQEDNNAAVLTFSYAKAAEAEHAKYYNEALQNLDNWREAKMAFYVCPTCGYTTNDLSFAECPECGEPKDEFEKIG